jgi:DNA-binding ferritin-like protein (Dps family)
MIPAKQLIEMNNHRRTQLTPENEKFYSDFMIYIRLQQLSLSEQQSEEVLLEILDHLVEGQNDGKSVQVIFGDDPKEYADEIIRHIPKEKKRNMISFFSGIALNLISYFLMTRGVLFFIFSYFKPVDTEVYPFRYVIMAPIAFCSLLFCVWGIFKIINSSIFSEKKSTLIDSLKAGVLGMLSMGMILAVGFFLPYFGPAFDFTWYASLLSGVLLWVISYFLKKQM